MAAKASCDTEQPTSKQRVEGSSPSGATKTSRIQRLVRERLDSVKRLDPPPHSEFCPDPVQADDAAPTHFTNPRLSCSDVVYSPDLMRRVFRPTLQKVLDGAQRMVTLQCCNLYVVVDGVTALIALPDPAREANALFAIVDAEDMPKLWGIRWTANPKDGGIYASGTVQGKRVYLHRFLCESDAPRIDHKNSDPLDCRRSNLRPCTASQNCWNRGPSKGRKFKGVYQKTANSWCAKIGVNGGQPKYIGSFRDAETAARAYDAAARRLHGDFARLNFPDAA